MDALLETAPRAGIGLDDPDALLLWPDIPTLRGLALSIGTALAGPDPLPLLPEPPDLTELLVIGSDPYPGTLR